MCVILRRFIDIPAHKSQAGWPSDDNSQADVRTYLLINSFLLIINLRFYT